MGRHGEGGQAASQITSILNHLKRGWSLTPLQALSKYGCNRLAARIRELREQGHRIHTDIITVTTSEGRKARVARYSMLADGGRGADV